MTEAERAGIFLRYGTTGSRLLYGGLTKMFMTAEKRPSENNPQLKPYCLRVIYGNSHILSINSLSVL